MSERILPAKVAAYLRRLQVGYSSFPDITLSEIISVARLYVREDTEHDSWNGGTYGHDVVMFVPLNVLGDIDLDVDEQLRDRLRSDLNKCASSVPNEFVRAVAFEPEDDNDPEFKRSRPISGVPQVSPDSVSFWKPGQIRLFVSHRDTHKHAARALSDALEEYGISPFVAHDTIAPMSTWRDEVRKGLDTMEVMLAFVTDDFDESPWTQQEAGFALGRGVPIISLQLEKKPPSGFLEATQAIKGRIDQPTLSTTGIYRILSETLDNKPRMQSALISAFIQSPDFNETRDRFDRVARVVDTLTSAELSAILRGFRENDQLNRSIYLLNQASRLTKFLERTTGKKFGYTSERGLHQIFPGFEFR
ncbi:MAG: toll/interleukin-1 receptor domain-containing protein [Terricaulis sp.]